MSSEISISNFLTSHVLNFRNSEDEERTSLQTVIYYGKIVTAEMGLTLLALTSIVECVAYGIMSLVLSPMRCSDRVIKFSANLDILRCSAMKNMTVAVRCIVFDNNVFSGSFNSNIDLREIGKESVLQILWSQLETIWTHFRDFRDGGESKTSGLNNPFANLLFRISYFHFSKEQVLPIQTQILDLLSRYNTSMDELRIRISDTKNIPSTIEIDTWNAQMKCYLTEVDTLTGTINAME